MRRWFPLLCLLLLACAAGMSASDRTSGNMVIPFIAPNGPNHAEVINKAWIGPAHINNTAGVITVEDPAWHISINDGPEIAKQELLYESNNGESWFAHVKCAHISSNQVDCKFHHWRASDNKFGHDDNTLLFRNPDGFVNRLTVTGFIGNHQAPPLKLERLERWR